MLIDKRDGVGKEEALRNGRYPAPCSGFVDVRRGVAGARREVSRNVVERIQGPISGGGEEGGVVHIVGLKDVGLGRGGTGMDEHERGGML